jgi:hypothetical protein
MVLLQEELKDNKKSTGNTEKPRNNLGKKITYLMTYMLS